jgi:GlpG protein
MRQAGTLTTKQDAQRFANYLLTLDISSKVEPAGDAWAIWIRDENQIPRSREELEQFQRQPDDVRYQAAEHAAKAVRREAAEKIRQAQKNYVDMRNVWDSPWRRRPVTLSLIAASVLMTSGLLEVPKEYLMFSMPEIAQGEVWRLITPIFLHGSLLHLLFNMWWLYDLGTLIERRLGSLQYAGMVLVIALVSNYGQFLAAGPRFLGMSGVVYGLFGYAWVRGRLDPTCGLYLRPDVVFWMMGWFVLCWLNLIGPVANVAHGVGLVAGALLGYLPHIRKLLIQNT